MGEHGIDGSVTGTPGAVSPRDVRPEPAPEVGSETVAVPDTETEQAEERELGSGVEEDA